MSAETLREAARLMRDDWPSEHSDEIACEDYHPSAQFHQVVADWLEATARVFPIGDDGQPFILEGSTYDAALVLARVYLGTDISADDSPRTHRAGVLGEPGAPAR